MSMCFKFRPEAWTILAAIFVTVVTFVITILNKSRKNVVHKSAVVTNGIECADIVR